jgi:hypothetical protein
MALLHDVNANCTLMIESELLVGRSVDCGLRIPDPSVSAQHAVLRWLGTHWELRDLGSRNGTYLNGVRLPVGRALKLGRGDKLTFGQKTLELTDDAPPRVMAVPLDGGKAVAAEDNVIGLPSHEEPQATIFRDANGLWALETADGDLVQLEHHLTFNAAGKAWRFSCATVDPTTVNESDHGCLIALHFSVSRDEENVDLVAKYGERTIELGSRSHNYILLTLARARLEDARNGIPGAASGWVYQDELLNGLDTSPSQFNIDVFRIRKHFARAGLHGSVSIIERRPRSKQVRLGIESLEIETA